MTYKKVILCALMSVSSAIPSEENQQIVKPISTLREVSWVADRFPWETVSAAFELCHLDRWVDSDTHQEKLQGGKDLSAVLEQLDNKAAGAARRAPLGQEEQARDSIYQHVPCVVRSLLGSHKDISDKVIDEIEGHRSYSKDSVAIKKIRSIIAPEILETACEKFITENGKSDCEGISVSFPHEYDFLYFLSKHVPEESKQGLFIVADNHSTPRTLVTPLRRILLFGACNDFLHSSKNASFKRNIFDGFAQRVSMEFEYNTCEKDSDLKEQPRFMVTQDGVAKEVALSGLKQFRGTNARIKTEDCRCYSIYKVLAVDGKPTVSPVLQ